jgi:hypothetical protein
VQLADSHKGCPYAIDRRDRTRYDIAVISKRKTLFAALAILLLLAGCGAHEVTKQEWSKMSATDKDMVVRSLIGGEAAANAKGGFGEKYTKSPDFYRAEIDRRYAAGDERSVNEVWGELKDGS